MYEILILDHIPGSHELRLLKPWISSTVSGKLSHCLVHTSVQGLVLHHTPRVQSETTTQSFLLPEKLRPTGTKGGEI